MGIQFKTKGNFKKTHNFLDKLKKFTKSSSIDKYGQKGVEALKAATPVGETGTTADSWTYKIVEQKGKVILEWHNTNINNGCNIAIILQYGHATGNGGYVQGIDYINPALKPVFDDIANSAWEDIKRL